MLDFIAVPIGYLLKYIYEDLAFKNYGLAIIFLTIIVRTFLLPLYIKQYKAISKINEIQPQIQKIQKKYKNDNEKLNQEIMKLYYENKINPVSGFLPLLIQMPILFSLYFVISQPLKYMFRKTPDVIQKLFEGIPLGPDKIANMPDLSIINYYSKHLDKLPNVSQMLNRDDLLNMNFFGINLGLVPGPNLHHISAENAALLLIPVLSAITTYISIKYSVKESQETNENQMQNSMQLSMNLFTPIMTGIISFTVPAGLGLYWIVGNVYQTLQQLFMDKFIIKNSSKIEKDKDEKRLQKITG
ncbi:YidC/Oxa1 family membrane protein insertase [Thermoanaerobacterium butyriciformans]|uniref:YidC/Oxa1 family membrane protein insertase n=1 Tax=Thermoanaerobacterium butyriciformans TaxID=1702242 RepID=A0ABS4NCA2_9THEO|nr:YidC/Oxa1 family membrane protein insertase [Thermoanaerobacterium butyriciformans]MBP2071308.1 YidC/Oxa1 family membrane protein insertase [Thermoanaerobacterium butyriciformans]